MSTTVAIGAMHFGVSPVVVIGAGLLGIVLLIGLLTLLANPRTRGPVMGLLLVVGFLAVTGWFVRVRTSEEHLRQDAAWQAGAQMRPHALPEQPAPEQPAGDENVTVVLSPPDRTTAGKAADDGISVKIHQDGRTGKGTIIYVKANRALEALGKALLNTIREHGSEKPAEPDKSPVTPAKGTVVFVPPLPLAFRTANTTPIVAGQRNGLGKSVSVPPPKAPAAPAGVARTAPPPRAKSPSPPEKVPPPGAGAYEETVTAYGTEADCEAALDDQLQEAFSNYVKGRLGSEANAELQLPVGEIRKCIVSKSRENVQLTGLGPMVRLTAVVRFDKEFQDRVTQEWAKVHLSERLWYLGGGLGVVLLFLSIAYGYLKIDLATGGAYRWRLRLAAATILVGMAAASAAFLG